MFRRKAHVNLRGISKARVFLYEELTRPALCFLVMSLLINEELPRPVFLFYEELAGPAFSYYEVFTTNCAYVELTSLAFFNFLGYVVSSSLVYEKIARIMFKSLKPQTPSSLFLFHIFQTPNPIFLIFYFIYSKA